MHAGRHHYHPRNQNAMNGSDAGTQGPSDPQGLIRNARHSILLLSYLSTTSIMIVHFKLQERRKSRPEFTGTNMHVWYLCWPFQSNRYPTTSIMIPIHLFALLILAASQPFPESKSKDTQAPCITHPNASSVWYAGSRQTVTWYLNTF